MVINLALSVHLYTLKVSLASVAEQKHHPTLNVVLLYLTVSTPAQDKDLVAISVHTLAMKMNVLLV